MTDPFDLQRFVDAQAPVYPRVLRLSTRVPSKSKIISFIEMFPIRSDLDEIPGTDCWLL
jgi:uncharacterized protein (DUF1810 family)